MIKTAEISLFPFGIIDVHFVIWLISLVPAPDVQEENRFGMKIRLGFGWKWRKTENQFKIN